MNGQVGEGKVKGEKLGSDTNASVLDLRSISVVDPLVPPARASLVPNLRQTRRSETRPESPEH